MFPWLFDRGHLLSLPNLAKTLSERPAHAFLFRTYEVENVVDDKVDSFIFISLEDAAIPLTEAEEEVPSSPPSALPLSYSLHK